MQLGSALRVADSIPKILELYYYYLNYYLGLVPCLAVCLYMNFKCQKHLQRSFSIVV